MRGKINYFRLDRAYYEPNCLNLKKITLLDDWPKCKWHVKGPQTLL